MSRGEKGRKERGRKEGRKERRGNGERVKARRTTTLHGRREGF